MKSKILDATTAQALIAESKRLTHLELFHHKITPAAAKILATWRGTHFYFRALSTIDAASAEALASWKGRGKEKPYQLLFQKMKKLSPETASKLALWEGGLTLGLDELVEISPEAAAMLRTNPRVRLPKELKISPTLSPRHKGRRGESAQEGRKETSRQPRKEDGNEGREEITITHKPECATIALRNPR